MSKKSFAQKAKELLRMHPAERMDKFDKIKAYWLGEIQLTDDELEQLRKYKIAFGIYVNDNSRHTAITTMANELAISESQCYAILRDAIKLYGDALKFDKLGERMASREHYLRIAKLAEEQKEYEVAVKARVHADKLLSLFEPDEQKIPVSVLFPATTIIFSSEEEVLKENQTEDIDFELENE